MYVALTIQDLTFINADDLLPSEYKGEEPPEDFAEQLENVLDELVVLPNGDVCHKDHIQDNGYKLIG